MTAYTPGETLHLLDQPAVQDWHAAMANFRIPPRYRVVALVPCAKTKPWADCTRGIYASYNRLRRELTDVFFLTVSEPLGIVPQTRWADFPLYDNPGLFRDLSQRSGGFHRADWLHLLGRVAHLPFDDDAYREAIGRLAEVVARFADANLQRGRIWHSFVEDEDYHPARTSVGTHSAMLTLANTFVPFLKPEDRLRKRGGPRQQPYSYLRDRLCRGR